MLVLSNQKLLVRKDLKWLSLQRKLVSAMYLSKEHQAQVRGLHLRKEVPMVAKVQENWTLSKLQREPIASMKRNLAMQVQGAMKDLLPKSNPNDSCLEKAHREPWKNKMMALDQILNLVF